MKAKLAAASDDLFTSLVTSATSVEQVVRYFGMSVGATSYRTVKRRCEKLGLSYEKLKAGYLTPRRRFHTKETLLPLLRNYAKTEKTVSGGSIKRSLLRLGILKNLCAECGRKPRWNKKPLTLHLDHINGKRWDWRLENLRILCPNCHSQTETYSGKNIPKG